MTQPRADAVQEALIAAAAQWPEQGIPRNPRGWLYHVALRRLTDQVRSEMARRRREEAVAGELWAEWAFVPPLEADVSLDQDDSLALLFMCCHPSLTPPSAIALTLRAVGGLATAEIARAFLVPEATMAQRISRAKQSIRSSGIAFSLPDEVERAARLDQVLQVLYLIFNEGYTTSEGPLAPPRGPIRRGQGARPGGGPPAPEGAGPRLPYRRPPPAGCGQGSPAGARGRPRGGAEALPGGCRTRRRMTKRPAGAMHRRVASRSSF